MIDVISDLHLHSRYSRAVSPQMIPPVMAEYGEQKGIELLGTGDWTHPLWFREIKNYLIEAEEGIYKIKKPVKENEKTRFLLSVEISSIYSQQGKGERIHNLLMVPSFETAEKINKEFIKRGYNITSDGRPILGLSSRNLLELVLSIDERSLMIPAHVWTPWFGIYGQMSGFDTLTDAFGDLAGYIYGIETGLSSDPEMNWQIDELNTRSILSFSDAHSPVKMGREATVFRLQNLTYHAIREAIMSKSLQSQGIQVKNSVCYTIEFYPEEGKYHYSGHRKCHISYTPEQMLQKGTICPVCHRRLTDGVMRRVQELAQQDSRGRKIQNKQGLTWITDPESIHPPFVKIVPLLEIIAQGLRVPVTSIKAKNLFTELCHKLESEFYILLHAPIPDIARIAGDTVAEGVKRVREARVIIQPGYDGIYGTVSIWQDEENVLQSKQHKTQIGIDF